MRIGIEASCLAQQRTGIENYVWHLARALIELGGHEYVAYGDPSTMPPDVRARVRVSPLRRAEWDEVDLYHFPAYFVPPLRSKARIVVTIHDLIILRRPQDFPVETLRRFREGIEWAMQRADRIIAISASTRRDLTESFPVQSKKIEVVYPGVGAEFRPVSDPRAFAAVRARYGLPEVYLLTVASQVPRKNLPRVLEAWARLRDELPAARAAKLVAVGTTTRGTSNIGEVLRVIEEHRLADSVIITGYVPAADLPALYSGARAFVYASLYEGFGLPPLEAMACGVPVVVSNTSALPEVVGDAGLQVDPHDTGAIATALGTLFSDRELAGRLARAGLERARAFTWERAASSTRAVYERA